MVMLSKISWRLAYFSHCKQKEKIREKKQKLVVQLAIIVVATTRWNGTHSMLTSAKLLVGYLVVGITRELDKEPLLYCSSIYITYRWSMLQQCVYLMSYYSFTMLLPQGHYAMFMCPDVRLFNLHHHVCTMCTL